MMTDSVFKAPKAKRTVKGSSPNQHWSSSPRKRRRTREDFFAFCNVVLEYTNYESMRQEDIRSRNNTSPQDSGGSAAESFTSETSESASSFLGSPEIIEHDHIPNLPENESDEELITCFCLKPYGGRPMIECSECNTWIHFSCAKIRKTNVPDVFICQNCRDSKTSTRKSGRIRSDKKVMDA